LIRILSVPERIKLFKEINRVHKQIYGSRMLYRCAWGGDYINIENDVRLDYHNEWVPINRSDAGKYYFYDDKGKDIPSLLGIFAWEAYDFYHLNPYEYRKVYGQKLADEDLISDYRGKRIRPDISHPIRCQQTYFNIQQRREGGKVWISSSWLYHYDCYGSGPGAGSLIYETLSESVGGDEKEVENLQKIYEEISDANGYEFKKALKRYFKGGKLQYNYWNGGYLFAASKEWRIKTLDQLNEAIEEEDKHFRNRLEEFIGWLRSNGLNLGKNAEEGLRKKMKEFYDAYLCNTAKKWCKFLVEEDKVEPSDVYLWWGGEPNSDDCYAFLTLFFDIDPDEIGSPRFDKRVSRNLRAIINIAEKEHYILSLHREYEPKVWNIVFS